MDGASLPSFTAFARTTCVAHRPLMHLRYRTPRPLYLQKFTTRHATWQIHSLLMRDDSLPALSATGSGGGRSAASAAAQPSAAEQPLVCTADDPAQAVAAVEAAVAASRARHTDASTRPPKPDVILVHGHSAGSALWEAVLDRLAPLANLHVLDMPGWGRSPLPPQLEAETRPERIAELHVEMLVGWMAAVGLAGGDAGSSSNSSSGDSSSSSSGVDRRPILVGHSFGGFHSVQLASRYAYLISQLILVAPAGLTPMVPSGGVVWGFLFRYMPPQRISRIFGRLGFLIYKTLALALIKEDARLPDYYYQLAAQTAATGCGDVVASRFFALNWSPRALLAGHGGSIGRAIAKLLPAPRPRSRASFAVPSTSAAASASSSAVASPAADPALDAINDAAAAAAAGSASLGMQFWWRLPMLTRLMNLPASLPVCIVFGQADDLLHPIFAPLLHRIRPATDCYLVRHALHNPAHNAPHAFCDAVADAIIKVRSRGAARAVVLAPGEGDRCADGTADVLLDPRCPPSRVLRVDYGGAALAAAAEAEADAGRDEGQGAAAAYAGASDAQSAAGSAAGVAELAAAEDNDADARSDAGADADADAADNDAEADVCCSGSVGSTGSSSMRSESTLDGGQEGSSLRCRSHGGSASAAERRGSGRLTVAVPAVGETADQSALLSSSSSGSAASKSSSACSSVCSSSTSNTSSSGSCLSSEFADTPSAASAAAAATSVSGRGLTPLCTASLDGDAAAMAAAGAARRRHSHSVEHGDHQHHHHSHHHHQGLHMEAVVDAPALGAGPSTGKLHLMEPATPATFARVSAAAAAATSRAKAGLNAAHGSSVGATELAEPTAMLHRLQQRRLALAGGVASAVHSEAGAASNDASAGAGGSSPVLLGARRASAGSAADAHVQPKFSSGAAPATASSVSAAAAPARAEPLGAAVDSNSSNSGFGFGRGFCHGCFRPVELHKSYWRCACAAWSSNTWGDANATAAHFAALVAFLDELYVAGTFNARTSTAIPLYLAVRTPLPPPAAAPGSSAFATPTASSTGGTSSSASGAATPARAPWRRPGAQPVPLSEHTGLPGFKPLPAPFQRGEALLLD